MDENPGAEKMATLQHYMADREVRVRAWHSRAETFARERDPNAGHRALVDLERRGTLHTLITQNVDGLHRLAGSSADRIVEIHGTIREVVCMECGERAPMERALARVEAGEEDPPCRTCGGILKSATISFGQALVPEDLMRAQVARVTSCSPWVDAVRISDRRRRAGRWRAGARRDSPDAEPTEMDDVADASCAADQRDLAAAGPRTHRARSAGDPEKA